MRLIDLLYEISSDVVERAQGDDYSTCCALSTFLLTCYTLQTQPELAAAAVSDPRRFAELLRELSSRRADQERHRTLEIERLNADPFDVEAQQRIEEAIRQEAVLENLEHAIEYAPESFGRVTML